MSKQVMLSSAILLLVGFIVFSTGDVYAREYGWEIDPQIVKDDRIADLQATLQAAYDAFEQRENQAKARDAVSLFEQAWLLKPDGVEICGMLARAYYWLADAFAKNEDEKIELHHKGAQWGERGIYLSPLFRQQIDKGKGFKDAVKHLSDDYLLPMYWTASNLGRYGNLKGFMATLKTVGDVKALNARIEYLDPTYAHAGALRFFGAYYAKAPGLFGGDMDKSKEYFERAFAIDNDYFVTHVLYAEMYAVKAKEKELFKKHLQFVLDTPSDVIPDKIPEQNLEKKKAADLMKQIDELF